MQPTRPDASSAAMDPIVTEIIRHQLLGVAEDMNITMRRTTRSVIAKETNDFSAALLDGSGRPIMLAMPYGLRAFAHAGPRMVAKWRDRFRPGDVIISNDPYQGTSHLPDIVAVMPIFSGNDVVAFSATYQHHTDMGGRFPGGYGTASRELYEEGLRLPIIPFYLAGAPNTSVHEIIAANVRSPEDVLGDLEANSAACRRGAAGLTALFAEHGVQAVLDAAGHFVKTSESFLRDVIEAIPDGAYRAEGAVDDGRDVHVDLVLTSIVKGNDLIVDLTGSSAQVDAACNVPPGMAVDGILNTVLGFLNQPDLVVNAGLLDPITVRAPLGTVFNPVFPAAVAQRGLALFALTDMMLDTLALAIPGRFPAMSDGGHPTMIYTSDPDQAESGTAPKVLIDVWCGGWSARPTVDGVDGAAMMAMLGFRNSSAELLELTSYVSVEGFGYLPDTGGPGKRRGNLSMFRRFRVERPGRLMLRTPRSNLVGAGRDGGLPGAGFHATLTRDGVQTTLPAQTEVVLHVRPGDIIEHVCPGGGGHGDPWSREPDRVLADVADGKVSVRHAREAYGVVIDPGTMSLDEEGTRLVRVGVASGAGAHAS